MSDNEFNKLSRFVTNGYGIKLPVVKKIMVEARLLKRLKVLNLDSYSSYLDIVFNSKENNGELKHMIDALTTNKTDFFREPVHFDFLKQSVLPGYLKKRSNEPIKVWSAGCSSGEEPYTIAMSISDFSRNNQPLDYRILGSDLSSRILKMAKNAVYTEPKTADIPEYLKKKYMVKSKNPEENTLEFIPEIRSKVIFHRLNFMDDAYGILTRFDLVFCRNVLIYFEKEVQERIINKICNYIKPGGTFLLGHSESIMNMSVPLEQIKPTIFRKI